MQNRLQALLSEIVTDGNHFVVGVKVTADRRKMTVALDGDEGVSVDYCAEVSRKLGEILEADESLGAFVLEVSSPGADAPLVMLRQYPKHIGRELKINLTDGTELKAVLEAVDGNSLQLTYSHKEKGKKAELRQRTVLFEEIELAKVILSFK